MGDELDMAENDKGKADARATSARQDRLKLALRENLKRRKSQARGRTDAASTELPDAFLDDAGEKEPER